MSPIITGNRADHRHVLQGYPRGVRGPARSKTAVVLEEQPGFICLQGTEHPVLYLADMDSSGTSFLQAHPRGDLKRW